MQCYTNVIPCNTPYNNDTLCYAVLHLVLQQKYAVTPIIYGVMHCYTPYIYVYVVLFIVAPFYAVLHPILRLKSQYCVVLHLIYLCYIVLCNVSPCFAAEIHCYTNDMWCYAVLHLIYHTVVIHPVQLCLEREIQTHLLAEERFA